MCDILIATPGRLLDMLQREKVSLSQIKYLCLDEAGKTAVFFYVLKKMRI
jgi:superfamily II DNA/RNA helicase